MTMILQRHADIRLTTLEGEGVVLHMGSRRYFTVTETGLTILEALKTPRTFEQLVDAIIADYDVGRERATNSVRQFVDRCKDASLILERDP
jgi:hypothetical protein